MDHVWLLWLSTGVLAAVLLALCRMDIMETAGFRQMQAEQLLMNWNTSSDFLIYLFLCRGIPFYLLVLLTLKTGRCLFFNLYFLYCGFTYGVQAVLLAMQYGFAGIFICFFQFMPQLIFYLPALYLGYGLGKKRYHRAVGGSIILWTIGLLTEWYINPLIMSAGMKIFL
ncbi:MAG: hypothetical protein ACI4BB_10745 [Coprococcus sp.]